MTETAVHVALVTAPDRAVAERIVRTLVEEGLVACGNILGGLISIYRWQGAVEEATEALIILKTTSASVAELIRRVPELHPYDVPEVLVIPVVSGHAPYLDWVAESVA